MYLRTSAVSLWVGNFGTLATVIIYNSIKRLLISIESSPDSV